MQPQFRTRQQPKGQGFGGGSQRQLMQMGRQRPGPPPMISEILPKRLFMSNLEAASDPNIVQSRGITHIVSVLKTRMEDQLPPTLKRLWIPVIDIATSTLEFESKWPEALKFLRDCMDSGGVALIHCRAGMSRSSTILLAHLLDYHKMNLRDAWQLLCSKHPIAAPITPFWKALIAFEQRLFQETSPDHLLTGYKPSITLLDYQLYMLKIIFPRTPEQEFLKCVQEQQGNWLTAARVFHFNHPESLESFAMRYGVGATPYHPFCDLIAEVRPEEAPEEASSGGSGQRERVGIGYGSGGQGITAQQYQQYQMQAQQQARQGFGW